MGSKPWQHGPLLFDLGDAHGVLKHRLNGLVYRRIMGSALHKNLALVHHGNRVCMQSQWQLMQHTDHAPPLRSLSA